jgi:hypothetical protein
MLDLLGRPYRLGADGGGDDGAIDCIHLVYEVRTRLQLPCPPFQQNWYSAPMRSVLRDMLRWGERIEKPLYDGDVALVPSERWIFAVTWDRGLLLVSAITEKVRWCPYRSVPSCHYFRHKS